MNDFVEIEINEYIATLMLELRTNITIYREYSDRWFNHRSDMSNEDKERLGQIRLEIERSKSLMADILLDAIDKEWDK